MLMLRLEAEAKDGPEQSQTLSGCESVGQSGEETAMGCKADGAPLAKCMCGHAYGCLFLR